MFGLASLRFSASGLSRAAAIASTACTKSAACLATVQRCPARSLSSASPKHTLFKDLVERTRPKIKEMEPEQAFANQDKYMWIDVREDREWHDKGVVDVKALHTIERGLLERELPKCVPDTATPLMVYCAGAMRSVLAVHSLNELGYKDVTSLNGGFEGWKDAGLPVRPFVDESITCNAGDDVN